jgi:hypothetical protein
VIDVLARMVSIMNYRIDGPDHLDLLMSGIPVFSQIAMIRSSSPRKCWLVEGYVVAPMCLGDSEMVRSRGSGLQVYVSSATLRL